MTRFIRTMLEKLVDELAGTLAKGLVALVAAFGVAIWAFIGGHPEIGIVAVVVAAALILVVAGIWIGKRANRTQKQAESYREFRGLSFKVDFSSEFPEVVNREVNEAICAECGSSIEGSDWGQFGANVHFLRCTNGHYVGSDMDYVVFNRIKTEEREQARLKYEQEEQARKEALKKLLKERGENKPLAPDYDAGAGANYYSPGSPSNAGGRIPRPEGTIAQEFYDRVIWDFEQTLQREKFAEMHAKK